MPKIVDLINRDNLRFVIIISVLVFGLASGAVGHLPPPSMGAPPLFWWANSYEVVWVALPIVLIVLLLVGRNSNTLNKIPHLPFWLAVVTVALSVTALWATANFCREAVFADRVESRSLTFKGVKYDTYLFKDASAVKYDCEVKNGRGAIYAELTYRLEFPDEGSVNLALGRNDGRDKGMWVGAIATADTALMARGVPKTNVRADSGQEHNITNCLDMLKKTRTPAEYATIARIFQTPEGLKTKGKFKKKDNGPV